jgi:TonB-dependent SusC/RagA subfamily outer membrane receptor
MTMPSPFSANVASLLPWLVAWLTTATLVTATLALAALCLQRLLRGLVPARWLWVGAMTAAVLLSLSQPLRPAPTAPRTGSGTLQPLLREAVVVEPSSWERSLMAAQTVTSRVQSFYSNAGLAVGTRVAALTATQPSRWPSALVLAWPLASTLLGTLLLLSYRRQRQLVAQAPLHAIGTQRVRLSTDIGPAVVGLRTPDIVLPAWLLSRSTREQQLVVAHEQSHVDSGDHLVLFAANVTLVLMPWNLPLWFMAARTRLAIELDCDARVLRQFAAPREYGQLLIELSAALPSVITRASRLHGAPAFSYRASHLERRLHTMTARPARFRQTRRMAAALMATATLAVACKAELPTATDVAAMDVASAQRKAVAFTGQSDDARFFVNGVETSKADAMKISSDRIATIEVRKGDKGEQLMLVATTDASKTASFSAIESARTEAAPSNVLRLRRADSGTVLLRASTDSSPTRIRLSAKGSTGPTPLFILDGKRVDEAAMNRIAPSSIESVEVVKGAAGVALYGNDAANGVVVIKTKR